MYSAILNRVNLAVLVVFLGCVLAGCNVDGMWISERPPSETSRTRVSHPREAVDMAFTDQQEVDLVESLVEHRVAYHQKLEQLREFYKRRGYAHKENWAAFELKGLKSVKTFRYVLDAEIPCESLRPELSLAEADALYEDGLKLMREGGHSVPALYRQRKMVEAAQVFRALIEQYPNSDKIDDAAFMCGEIHKEYLRGQELLAVKWYERAWTWDPNTPHPARFQAAIVHDYRLHDRDRALELYQAVVREETDIKSNVRFATRRIHELTTDTRTAEANGG